MFATTRGTVRRNKLSDFVQVNRNGKIAMKFEEDGDEILGVETCTDQDDILLMSDGGRCIRFAVADLRIFQSRGSMGVRGLTLGADERLISMATLAHVDATPDERNAYLKRSSALRRAVGEAPADETAADGADDETSLVGEEVAGDVTLSDERFEELRARRAVRADGERTRLRQAVVVL